MELRLLGPLLVRADGCRLDITAPKQRAVLEYMGLRAGQVVPADELTEIIWGDDPPATAPKTLQNYVSRLRRSLPPGSIETTSGGYLLACDRGYVDAHRFTALAATARVSMESGAVPIAAELLSDALSLWRGPALPDLAGHERGRTEAVRLEEDRRAAEDDLVDARLLLGQHHALIGDLEAAVAAEPLRERRWAQLMTALYRGGRQADALRAYQRARDVLIETLGIEPGPELAALEHTVLVHGSLPGRAAPMPSGGGPPPSTSGSEPVVPLPARLQAARDSSASPFIGRGPEMQGLRAGYEAAVQGHRRAVLVAGDAGIGKTRLSAEICSWAHDRGATVLYGRCDEDLDVPYQPFVEALSQFLAGALGSGSALAGGLAARFGPHAGELARLIPELGPLLGDRPLLRSDPNTEQYRLFDAIAGWLAAASSQRPLVLVLDDIHWAARPTLLMLRHILLAAAQVRVLLIGTYRDAPPDLREPLTTMCSELCRLPGVERTTLKGLDGDELVEWLAAARGRSPGREERRVAHQLQADTGGNPLFAAELIRDLDEAGAGAATSAGLRIPDGLETIVNQRLERLGQDVTTTMEMASVMGDDFVLDVLARVTPLGEDRLVAALDDAVRARLVVETGVASYHFAHGLIRRSIYGRLSQTRRAQRHRQVAEAIEASGAPEETIQSLAEHWVRAAPTTSSVAKAVDYLARAGDQALTRMAYDTAVDSYQRALNLVEDTSGRPTASQRLELLLRLGDAQRRAGDAGHRATLLDAAELAGQAGDTSRLVRAVLANTAGRPSVVFRIDHERVAALENALAVTGMGDSPERARILAALALELTYSGESRPRSLSDEAVSMAHRIGDLPTLHYVLASRYGMLQGPGTLEERLAGTEEYLSVAIALADPAALFEVAYARVWCAVEAGDIVEVDRCLEFADEALKQVDEPKRRWHLYYTRAWREMMAGRLDEAEKLMVAYRDMAETTFVGEAPIGNAAHVMALAWNRGRLAEVVVEVSDVMGSYVDTPAGPAARAVMAFMRAELGQFDAAQALVDIDATIGFGAQPVNVTTVSAWCLNAYTCTRLGLRGPARDLYERLLPWRPQVAFGGAAVFGSVSHWLGILAEGLDEPDAAAGHYAKAAAVHEGMGAPILLARTRLRWARLLLRRTDLRGQAGRLVEQVGAASAALRLDWLADEVNDLGGHAAYCSL